MEITECQGGRLKTEGMYVYLYTYSWLTLLYDRNEHNIVKQFTPIKKEKKKE